MKTSTTELMEKWKELQKQKNKDYGSSWEKTGKILDILFDGQAIKIENVQDYNVLSLLVRILDKICRLTNIYFVQKGKMEVAEKLVETAGDCGTYMFMMGELLSEDGKPVGWRNCCAQGRLGGYCECDPEDEK